MDAGRGKQAENAAQYLGKGSHVNVAGRVQNNNYEREGRTVYAMVFTAEEIDYLDSRAEGDAIRVRGEGSSDHDGGAAADPAPQAQGVKPARRKAAAKVPAAASAADDDADIPF